MNILLKPVDSFFFRDHKDLNMGETSSARSLFPPRPGTVYGALRSAYIQKMGGFASFYGEEDEELSTWMGTTRKYGSFSIRGLFLAEGREREENGGIEVRNLYFPMPLDYMGINKEGKLKALPLRLTSQKHRNGAYLLLSDYDEKSIGLDHQYLTKEELIKAMLRGEEVTPTRQTDLLSLEEKTGIARDNKRKLAMESMLYTIETMRFRSRSLGLFVMTEASPDFSKVRFASLGGKKRPWTLHIVRDSIGIYNEQEKEELVRLISRNGLAKLLFITPTIWEKGSKPGGLSDGGTLRLPSGLEVEYLTGAIGRPVLIGGWDIARNRPKPRFNAIPAGSILYVKVPKEAAKHFVEATYLKKMSDRLPQEGYGLMLPGVVHREEISQ